jgi:hypothetical protein
MFWRVDKFIVFAGIRTPNRADRSQVAMRREQSNAGTGIFRIVDIRFLEAWLHFVPYFIP